MTIWRWRSAHDGLALCGPASVRGGFASKCSYGQSGLKDRTQYFKPLLGRSSSEIFTTHISFLCGFRTTSCHLWRACKTCACVQRSCFSCVQCPLTVSKLSTPPTNRRATCLRSMRTTEFPPHRGLPLRSLRVPAIVATRRDCPVDGSPQKPSKPDREANVPCIGQIRPYCGARSCRCWLASYDPLGPLQNSESALLGPLFGSECTLWEFLEPNSKNDPLPKWVLYF